MKRSRELETLSWEHHEALVIAKRILRGLERGADPAMVRDYLLSFWANHLEEHFRQEEAHLSPAMEDDLECRRLCTHMRAEHRAFAERIHLLRSGDVETISAELGDFAEDLRAHVSFEEKELFPHAEKVIPAERLQAIGAALHSQHTTVDKGWEPAFWKDR
jgi:hemerythrin-like domain-containing protein